MAAITNHYDVVVAGSDLAGLVAAALCAHRGYRVLVAPAGQPEPAYQLAGRSLPTQTDPVSDLSHPVVERVLRELGLLQQVRREGGPCGEVVQYAVGDVRVDAPPGPGVLTRAVADAWPTPEAAAAWTNHVEAIAHAQAAATALFGADASPWDRRWLARVDAVGYGGRAPLVADAVAPELGTLAGLPLAWCSDLASEHLSAAARGHLLAPWTSEPRDSPRRGVLAVREWLLRRIEAYSGDVKRELRIGEFLAKRGRFAGFSLLGRGERYGADDLVLACDLRSPLGELATSCLDPEAGQRARLQIRDVGARFVLHLEVAASGLSPGLRGMVLVAPSGGAGGVGAHYLRVAAGDQEDTRRISITRIVAPDEPLADLRERVLGELDERGILPFVAPHVRWAHSPHDGREPTDGAGHTLRLAPALTLQRPMVPIVSAAAAGGAVVSPPALAPRNTAIAARIGAPGFGIAGEFLVGLAAADRLRPAPARAVTRRAIRRA